ncbi:hypothetical protein [Roseateles saccharophilus]|uniref:Uncharacterized protein n=1 Tax=Roseateles saccharophilus TaxID=304 RepID=A0A4R3VA47_ROSSA|nr:hypothetical protein [Roseateles saccharophilus]MDG0831694.1 hypothetical protein [Roseateles saccharophilus]TCV00891.1 hypothetical protein EV671_100720 [Roseateles saccharophilus]
MDDALDRLARELSLDTPAREGLRLRFGLACAQRVHHLLEDPAVVACLDVLARFVAGHASREELDAAAAEAARLANHHPGSRSLDGVGHAAVSASYAVANALAGRALRAAEYAAYAAVYGGGGYGAVQQRESFQPEFDWQRAELARLAA